MSPRGRGRSPSPCHARLGRYVAIALGFSLAACSPPGLHGGPASPVPADGTIRITATALPLNPNHPKHDRVGDFVFAGALELTSPDTSLLGGLSDLTVADDGSFLAVSDEGSLLSGHIVLDDAGRIAGVDRARIRLLTGVDGKPLPNKAEADAEGLAVWPNGDVMVSFERHHRIWLYPAGGGRPRPAPKPDVVLGDNAGLEALALAPKEGADAYWVGAEAGGLFLCRLGAACAPAAGRLPPPAGYRLTALFETADGDLVVDHRGWDPVTGPRVVISLIDNPAAKADPAVRAQLRLAPPLTVDNVEGVAVVERAGGVKRFYLITDNNFSRRQKTLLMAFDWTPRKPRAAGK